MHEHKLTADVLKQGQYLSFRIGDDDYALDILRVQEIRGWEKVRELPDSRDYVKGVLDMRGTIVPIIDLRIRFGNPNPDYSATTVVIVVAVEREGDQRQLVGTVVDSVSDVLDVDTGNMKPPPRIGRSGNAQRYLEGMVSLDRGMVVLLNLDSLFESIDLDELINGHEYDR